jgi:hypothetical protein
MKFQEVEVMAHKYKYKYYLIVSSIVLFLMLAIAIYSLYTWIRPPSSPSEGFKRYVCNPIPKSVKEIKIHRSIRYIGGWHRYVLHFKIDEADLSPILNVQHSMFVPRPFQELQYFEYDPVTGHLTWAKELQHIEGMPPFPRESFGMYLYNIGSGETAPEWFNVEQWDNPKVYVYVVRDVYRLRFLVYNQKLGEAYFIDWRSPD